MHSPWSLAILQTTCADPRRVFLRAQDGSGYGAANPIRRSDPSEAAKRGAVAYLLRSLGTDSHRLPHTGALNYENGTPRIPAAALAIPDADQLERLTALGPVRIRLVLTPTVHENAPSWNVVGEIKGADRPEEIVLIGGHLDSWIWAPAPPTTVLAWPSPSATPG
jgi:carboxypeptidase Q